MNPRQRLALASLVAVLAAVWIGELCFGAIRIAPSEVLAGLFRHPAAAQDPQALIVWNLRLPRAVLALLAGAALATAGTGMQALFRNPLAEPGIAGVSAGSALAAAAVFALSATCLSGWPRHAAPVLLPLAAFGGGTLTAVLVTGLARRSGSTQTAPLLLAGVAVNAVAGAGIGWISLRLPADALHNYLAWAYGDLGRAGWLEIAFATPPLLIAILAPLRDARALDALLLGDAEAAHLGVRVEALKRRTLLFAVLAAAATAAAAGPISFIGLIAPHIARRLFGVTHRRLLPAAALTGAVLLVAADLTARLVARPSELPVGLLTALLGGPFFLLLLASRRGIEDEP